MPELEEPPIGEYLAMRPGFCDLCGRRTGIGCRVFYDWPLRMCIDCSGLDSTPQLGVTGRL